MIIYVRTAAGNEAALNHNSALPRKLRTLLIAIDGRTRAGTYVNSLSSFGDVDALLGSLREAGLIEAVASPGSLSVIDVANAQMFPDQSASWRHTDADRAAFTEPPPAPAGALARFGNVFRRADSQPAVPGTDDLASWSTFKPPAPVSPPVPSAGRQAAQAGYYALSSAAGSASTAHYQLRNAISLMSDFVTNHLPADSLEIVLALEGLGSVEQVLASLKGYEALVVPVGEPAHRHLAELRAVLTRI